MTAEQLKELASNLLKQAKEEGKKGDDSQFETMTRFEQVKEQYRQLTGKRLQINQIQ